jgi:hypothetical protein
MATPSLHLDVRKTAEIVPDLAAALKLDPSVRTVVVAEYGMPERILRRTGDVGNLNQALMERGSYVEPGIRLSHNVIIAGQSILRGEIEVGDNVILDNFRLSGRARIEPNWMLRGYNIETSSEKIILPADLKTYADCFGVKALI